MNLIDEEDRAFFEICQDRGEVAGPLDGGAGGGAHRRVHLVAADEAQGCLAEAGRSVKEDMVERVAAGARGVDRDLKVLLQPRLPDELAETLGTQGKLAIVVLMPVRI